jgi:hypothetical protein
VRVIIALPLEPGAGNPPGAIKLNVVFRRRSAGAGGAVDETDASASGTPESDGDRAAGGAYTPSKGRPTPKRSEAERRRRNPYAASGDRKAVGQQAKNRDRADRARKYEAMKRGEEWALAARDRGPVKALTRDMVDSKRRISEYYMYVLIFLMALLFINSKTMKDYMYPVVLVLALIILTEGTMISRAVRRQAAVRFPGESTRGITMYAMMRALQIRRFRMPSPRVKPGEKI